MIDELTNLITRLTAGTSQRWIAMIVIRVLSGEASGVLVIDGIAYLVEIAVDQAVCASEMDMEAGWRDSVSRSFR